MKPPTRTHSRRRVLKAAGSTAGAAIGLSAVAGSASAHSIVFYGCSQVCSNTYATRAVLAMEDGTFECQEVKRGEGPTDRGDVPWNGKEKGVHCLSVDDVEGAVAIVGVCADGRFIRNGEGEVNRGNGRCAENYLPEDFEQNFDCEACEYTEE